MTRARETEVRRLSWVMARVRVDGQRTPRSRVVARPSRDESSFYPRAPWPGLRQPGAGGYRRATDAKPAGDPDGV